MVKRDYYLFAILAVLLMGLVVVMNIQSTPGFSKVYFDNATVPEYVIPDTTYTVVFIIESHERSRESYSYTVYFNGTLISRGRLFLSPGDVVQIPFNFSVNDTAYRKVVLWEKNITYYLNGIWAIMGKPINNVTAVNITSPGYRLPSYVGSANLSFLLNTTRNITIKRTVILKNPSGITTREYTLRVVPLGDEMYRISEHEVEFVYMPDSVLIKVIVETSGGRTYQIFRSIPMGDR